MRLQHLAKSILRRQHERVRRSAKNTSLNTARLGVPRTSTRAPGDSTIIVAAPGDPEAPQPPVVTIPTPKARLILSASAAPIDLNAPGAGCCGRQPWRCAIICYNRARLEVFRDNLCLQIIRPVRSAYTSIRGDNGRLMSSEWSSIVSTLAKDDSSNGALRTAHKQSGGRC